MGLYVKQSSAIQGMEVWQKILEVAQGGFTIDSTNTELTGVDEVPAGSLVSFDEATRKVNIDKTAVVYATANSTSQKIKKDHCLAVGDIVAKTVGGTAYAITAIDKSNADYDTITVATALDLTEGDILWLSSAAGATTAAYLFTPNGVLKNRFKPDQPNDMVSVVLRGTLYERRTTGCPSGKKSSLPHIIWSQSR